MTDSPDTQPEPALRPPMTLEQQITVAQLKAAGTAAAMIVRNPTPIEYAILHDVLVEEEKRVSQLMEDKLRCEQEQRAMNLDPPVLHPQAPPKRVRRKPTPTETE